jgi:hypothetical protein
MSSPTLITPLSILPVTTVPLPDIEKTSSIGKINGFFISLLGFGIYSSSILPSFIIDSISFLFPDNAPVADPLIIGVFSPGKSY